MLLLALVKKIVSDNLDFEPHDRSKHRSFSDTVKHVTSSMQYWAETYLTGCMSKRTSNKTNHTRRMNLWNRRLQHKLHCDYNHDEINQY